MSGIGVKGQQKLDYVLAAKRANESTDHHCHWPGCEKKVPPAMWGCSRHWYLIPANLRRRIWATFVPGQEISKTPSPEYVKAAMAVQDWIKANYP